MNFENTEVFNFKGAFHGMRNPKNSWDRSDSWFGIVMPDYDDGTELEVVDAWIEEENIMRREQGKEELSHDMEDYNEYYDRLDYYANWLIQEGQLSVCDNYHTYYNMAYLGPADLDLAQDLILAGDEHAKFMRQIFVSVDITAPLYWWKEMDTYKVGTTANSTSTMHKLTSKPLDMSFFEWSEFDLEIDAYTVPHGGECGLVVADYQDDIVSMCETLRQKYLETKDKRYWRALIQILPESYLQTRTWTADYQVLRNIYFQRKNHKLIEWHKFCDWIKSLPYANELIIIGDTNETN